MIYALIWLHVTPSFKIIHRRSADRAQNYLVPIEHRELNDHPIEVVAPAPRLAAGALQILQAGGISLCHVDASGIV
jgi:hypothetical protein